MAHPLLCSNVAWTHDAFERDFLSMQENMHSCIAQPMSMLPFSKCGANQAHQERFKDMRRPLLLLRLLPMTLHGLVQVTSEQVCRTTNCCGVSAFVSDIGYLQALEVCRSCLVIGILSHSLLGWSVACSHQCCMSRQPLLNTSRKLCHFLHCCT